MIIRKSHYFDRFACLAGSCPDSCCHQWDVQIDPDTATYYRSLPGPLGQRLRSVMQDDPEYGTLLQNENDRCPMWRTDGLCQIQAELGESALCKVCREYPRLTHNYGDFIELGLELSCPEAARLILTSPPSPPVETHVPGGEPAQYDEDAMNILLKSRTAAINILENGAYSVPQALQLFLYYSHHVQMLLDGETPHPFQPKKYLSDPAPAEKADSAPLLDFFKKLEILTLDWKNRLASPACSGQWAEEYRALARYGVERYWLQAVSDYDLVCRAKLIVVSCMLIHVLGGDLLSTAQLYSKEIENCAENLDAILDAAYTDPAFTDQYLLQLLA